MTHQPAPLDFFSHLKWIDGRPLLDTIEPYRREFLTTALYTFRDDGVPLYNLVLSGRGKKNWKSSDLVLAGFYRLLAWESASGNDGYILANDEEQSGDDLAIAKKLVAANGAVLSSEVIVQAKGIKRRDGRGDLRVLPAQDAVGAHGKTALFIGFDEIHGYRSWDLFEALAPDPTRTDTLTWITSYDTIFNSPGVPLYDLKRKGIAGDDDRMLFSWYSGDTCTDPAFADLSPEERANPSMGSWPEGAAYLEQQRRRLPIHKYRRLHLNLPGAPDGAYFDPGTITDAIVPGMRSIPPRDGRHYVGFVDMSGGSSDDATLAIAHIEHDRHVLDLLISQDGKPPFNPRDAVKKFVRALKEYGLDEVTGDAYAGQTFRHDFEDAEVSYRVSKHKSATEIYEAVEPMLNGGRVELLDLPKLQEQLLTLIVRGKQITHPAGNHDDWANAACGALVNAGKARSRKISWPAGRPLPTRQYDPLEAYR